MMTKITVLDASGKENLGQSLDHAEPEAGHDRAHDRAHAADHDDREHDDDQFRAHLRRNIVDRRRHHAGKCGKPDAKSVSQRDHARHIDAEGATSVGFSVAARR